MKPIPGLKIKESKHKLADGSDGKLAVFIYTGQENPKDVLDYAIGQYVGFSPYTELIDSNLDNPWMRVIITGINRMEVQGFDLDKHRL